MKHRAEIIRHDYFADGGDDAHTQEFASRDAAIKWLQVHAANSRCWLNGVEVDKWGVPKHTQSAHEILKEAAARAEMRQMANTVEMFDIVFNAFERKSHDKR